MRGEGLALTTIALYSTPFAYYWGECMSDNTTFVVGETDLKKGLVRFCLQTQNLFHVRFAGSLCVYTAPARRGAPGLSESVNYKMI